jgi:hypothetical protein
MQELYICDSRQIIAGGKGASLVCRVHSPPRVAKLILFPLHLYFFLWDQTLYSIHASSESIRWDCLIFSIPIPQNEVCWPTRLLRHPSEMIASPLTAVSFTQHVLGASAVSATSASPSKPKLCSIQQSVLHPLSFAFVPSPDHNWAPLFEVFSKQNSTAGAILFSSNAFRE